MAEPLNQSNWIYGISDEPLDEYINDSSGDYPDELIKFVTTEQQSAENTVNTANNEGHSTGNDWATEQWTQTHDVNFQFSIDPSILMLRRLLNAVFGFVETSTPTAGVTKDIFSPMDAEDSRQLPSYWISEKCAGAHDALYPSMVLEKATFKGEEFGKLNVAGNFRGSGRQILGADLDIVAETGKYYLKNTMSKIVRATAATPGTPVKTYSCGLQSFMFDVDNAHDANVGYDPGCQRFFTANDPDSGVIRSYHPFGRRKYTGSFVIWLEDSSPELALLRSQFVETPAKKGEISETPTKETKK